MGSYSKTRQKFCPVKCVKTKENYSLPLQTFISKIAPIWIKWYFSCSTYSYLIYECLYFLTLFTYVDHIIVYFEFPARRGLHCLFAISFYLYFRLFIEYQSGESVFVSTYVPGYSCSVRCTFPFLLVKFIHPFVFR